MGLTDSRVSRLPSNSTSHADASDPESADSPRSEGRRRITQSQPTPLDPRVADARNFAAIIIGIDILLPMFILCCNSMKRIHRRWNPDTRERSFHRPRIPSARLSPLLFPRPRVRVFSPTMLAYLLAQLSRLVRLETRVHPCQLGPRPQLAQLSRFVQLVTCVHPFQHGPRPVARAALTARIARDVCSPPTSSAHGPQLAQLSRFV